MRSLLLVFLRTRLRTVAAAAARSLERLAFEAAYPPQRTENLPIRPFHTAMTVSCVPLKATMTALNAV
ncbi:hypothetical protein, partial [Amycolatopsis sp. H20-H5]|uniref:hypothetical protein n=1 Tax=Amycolatopsis sp. H20-H5 TaxID=3046309 RepID=UPI002DB9514E